MAVQEESTAGHKAPLANPGSPPVTIIKPTRGRRSFDFREMWRHRELFHLLTQRDIKVRYKQTVLGGAWAILQPVGTMVVFAIFFGHLGGFRNQTEHAYPVFVYAALLPWQLFASGIARCAQSLIASGTMVTRIYFPRVLLPLSAIASVLIDFFLSFAVMLGLMWYYEVAFSARMLLLPILIGLLLLTTTGFGLLVASLNTIYRDFRYIITFTLQIWLFASPIAYSISIVPPQWHLLYSLNPLVGIAEGFRFALLGDPLHIEALALSVLVSLAALWLGARQFMRIERQIADLI